MSILKKKDRQLNELRCLDDYFQTIEFFRQLRNEIQRDLMLKLYKRIQIMKFSRRQVVYFQGDRGSRFYFVISGNFQVYREQKQLVSDLNQESSEAPLSFKQTAIQKTKTLLQNNLLAEQSKTGVAKESGSASGRAQPQSGTAGGGAKAAQPTFERLASGAEVDPYDRLKIEGFTESFLKKKDVQIQLKKTRNETLDRESLLMQSDTSRYNVLKKKADNVKKKYEKLKKEKLKSQLQNKQLGLEFSALKRNDSENSLVIEEQDDECSDMAPEDFDMLKKLQDISGQQKNSLLLKRFQWRDKNERREMRERARLNSKQQAANDDEEEDKELIDQVFGEKCKPDCPSEPVRERDRAK